MTDILDQHEKRVLGAALDAPGLWLAQINRIRPELFTTNRLLAEILCSLSGQGKPIDTLSVRARAEAGGVKISIAELEAIGDCAPLGGVAMKASVDALHKEALCRGVRALGRNLNRQGADPGVDIEAVVGDAMAKLAELSAIDTGGVKHLPKLITEMVSRLSRPKKRVVKTGLPTFDNKIGGMSPGQLVILGARPSMGKTALALNFASAAANAGRTVAIFSLEMSAAQITERIISQLSRTDLTRISRRRLSDVELQHVTNAAARAHAFNIFISETADQIEPICRQIKYKHGLDFIVIDYVQLMETKAGSREQEISKISRRLKGLARRIKAPVLALSQLNRAVEARVCKRPQLADLRESGSLEQDADIVMLLWRESYYSDDADPTGAELIVAKNRNGRIGRIDLLWSKESTRFDEPKAP